MKSARAGNPRIGVGYVRVSDSDQKLGPEAQRAAILAWAGREGVTIAAWAEDVLSGGSDLDDRPGLVAALGELRANRAGALVVLRRDRLARDVAIAVMVERAVGQCGARVVAADGVANGDNPADAFMRTILDAAAQYERALIRARTKAALAAKRAKGERAGELPYGFRLGADGVLLEEAPGEQAVLARVHELRASGLSLRAIVAELGRAAVTSRSGRPFGLTQVARMSA